MPLAKLRALVEYWRTDYDWRRCEATLNGFDQYRTEIDGLDIHFLHVRSPHADALPILITHGWPGSVIEFFKIIEPLTNPTAHGGRRRMRSTSSRRRCRASVFPTSRRSGAGTPTASPELGPS